jgi:HAD superfamily hydrolase (TIGR01509 family)
LSPQAYLFDYGGTLDGEGWHWFDRFVELYRRAGSNLPEAEIKRAFYDADARIAEEAAERQLRLRPLLERHVELQTEVLGEPVRRIAGKLVAGFCALTEEGWRNARAALARLRESARLGVVSNFYGNLDTMLDEAGLAPLLEVTIESVKVGIEKPDPRIYQVALDRLALPAAEVVMVGDNFERDLRPAKGLGMGTIWLRRVAVPPPAPGIADRIVATLAEIE